MQSRVRQYLRHRRACGYLLQSPGYHLQAFARFADRTAPGEPVTCRLALEWANQKTLQPRSRAGRLDSIRCFARFCLVSDPRTEVPPTQWSHVHRRNAPYILTPAQIRMIMERANKLQAGHSPLRPLTYRTLIGLLACTGLRITEALRLRCDDIDTRAGTLHVSPTKFSPARDLPVHVSTIHALEHYRRVRDRYFSGGDYLFMNGLGRRLTRDTAFRTWRNLVKDFPRHGARRRPRYHDLRHTFVTGLIAKWSRDKVPLAHRLVLLSRYLGHQQFKHTYWYVEPERSALAVASRRFERFRDRPFREEDS